MERPGLLLLLQADHLSGEEIGTLIERLHAWGAHVAQIVQTLAKKSRPGQLLLVDVEPTCETAVARGLAREFGISGYQRIETVHCHVQTACHSRSVQVSDGQRARELALTVKVIGDPDAPLHVRAEHDSLVALCADIRHTFGADIALPTLRRYLEERMSAGEPLQLELERSGEWR